MAKLESLTITTNECKATLVKASATIRDLIKQRNAALVAADPDALKAAQDETDVAANEVAIRSDLETARKDTEAAISEAGGIPAIPVKTAAAQYPKTLGDGTPQKRPNVVVQNDRDEAAARAAGFTVQILPPAVPQPSTAV